MLSTNYYNTNKNTQKNAVTTGLYLKVFPSTIIRMRETSWDGCENEVNKVQPLQSHVLREAECVHPRSCVEFKVSENGRYLGRRESDRVMFRLARRE